MKTYVLLNFDEDNRSDVILVSHDLSKVENKLKEMTDTEQAANLYQDIWYKTRLSLFEENHGKWDNDKQKEWNQWCKEYKKANPMLLQCNYWCLKIIEAEFV